MYLEHSAAIWSEFPQLVPGVLSADGIDSSVDVQAVAASFHATAQARLAASTEGELPEIQAWRRTFSKMGLKPTQYRCAAESLLRRFRKEQSLPQIHPLIDLCNAVSIAFAIPIAVFDTAQVSQGLTIRHASGDEDYLTFGDELEHPEPHEVIFVDAANRAHARRWSNRQSGLSAIRPETTSALIVAEALHESAPADITLLLTILGRELAAFSTVGRSAVLTPHEPRFEVEP